ncbi:MAG TPA: ATP-binding protein, partial [Nevskiaceae bacterium]|nr:ATP-binding protein [Nevskiaceae bacterium]
GTRLRMVAFRFQPPGSVAAAPACTLRYALDREPLRAILRALDYILLGTLLGGCALVLLLTPWLVRRTLRPLSVLDRAMADIGPDTPGKRLPVTGVTELAPVVDRFNQVLSRMDAGLAREHQFASGLAHEFRTRLAELRTLVDVETRYPSGRDSRSLLGEVGAIGGELEATVTALLQLTRIESGLEQAQREDISIAKFVTRACNRQRQTAERRGVPLVMDLAATADATVAADPALLEIVLDNLLGNAVAYAPAGTPVTVRADAGQVEIVNAARALRAEDLGNLGRRFWRKEAQGAGHAGLGLALAGAAARALHMPLNFRLQNGALHAVLQWSAEAGA